MKLHPSETAFLAALAEARNSWLKVATEAIANPAAAAQWSEAPSAWQNLARCLSSPEAQLAFGEAVKELLSGVLHSSLVTLDGGSVLAETTTLTIEDAEGHRFKSFLHEFWSEFSAL